MNPQEFFAITKRIVQIGSVGDLKDRVTSDILISLNANIYRIWRSWPWNWSAQDISVALTAATANYTMPSNIGEIHELYVSGETKRLKYVTRKEYLDWILENPVATGTPEVYIKTGRDADEFLTIRVSPTPSASGTILGWGKKRISTLSQANIEANAPAIPFIPTETHTVLLNFVLSDMFQLKGDKLGAQYYRGLADADLNQLIAAESANADEEINAPPPDVIRFRSRMRRKGLAA